MWLDCGWVRYRGDAARHFFLVTLHSIMPITQETIIITITHMLRFTHVISS